MLNRAPGPPPFGHCKPPKIDCGETPFGVSLISSTQLVVPQPVRPKEKKNFFSDFDSTFQLYDSGAHADFYADCVPRSFGDGKFHCMEMHGPNKLRLLQQYCVCL